tara:strand:+ start:163 stop:492 length:330 start_codon:yes stop_codon:yes gene_type:complete
MGLALYFSNANEEAPKAVNKTSKTVSKTPVSTEAIVLAAAIDKFYKDTLTRDTLIVQQILKIQHELKMHKSRVSMCPDCASTSSTKEYHTTDGFSINGFSTTLFTEDKE